MHDFTEDYAAASALRSLSSSMPCAYCGADMIYGDPRRHPTRDHIWPRAMRSADAGRSGKVWCCHACNQEKGDMSPSAWLAVVQFKRRRNEAPEACAGRSTTPKPKKSTMQVLNYFVSDPGGNYLAPTYPSMSAAQSTADELNMELQEERVKAGRDSHLGGSFVVGAHLADGTSTFEIG